MRILLAPYATIGLEIYGRLKLLSFLHYLALVVRVENRVFVWVGIHVRVRVRIQIAGVMVLLPLTVSETAICALVIQRRVHERALYGFQLAHRCAIGLHPRRVRAVLEGTDVLLLVVGRVLLLDATLEEASEQEVQQQAQVADARNGYRDPEANEVCLIAVTLRLELGLVAVLNVEARLVVLRWWCAVLVRDCRGRLRGTQQADISIVSLIRLQLLQLLKLLLGRSCLLNLRNRRSHFCAVVEAILLILGALGRAAQQTSLAFVVAQALVAQRLRY